MTVPWTLSPCGLPRPTLGPKDSCFHQYPEVSLGWSERLRLSQESPDQPLALQSKPSWALERTEMEPYAHTARIKQEQMPQEWLLFFLFRKELGYTSLP